MCTNEVRGRNSPTCISADNITVSYRTRILLCEEGAGHSNTHGVQQGIRMIEIERNRSSFDCSENTVLLNQHVPGHDKIALGDYHTKEFTDACAPSASKFFYNLF